MAIAANETSLSARKTSAPGASLSVTRKTTASRIWELGIEVKINHQQLVFDAYRQNVSAWGRGGRTWGLGGLSACGRGIRKGVPLPAVGENFGQELLGAIGTG